MYRSSRRYCKEKVSSISSFLKRTQLRPGWLGSLGGLKDEEFLSLSHPLDWALAYGKGELEWALEIWALEYCLLWDQEVSEENTKGIVGLEWREDKGSFYAAYPFLP